ncbi:MAG TPA: hypothetical protein VJY62_13450 [Bacteroidia bacterium]|nr:hypothetical protein [Bacteroidia bacterium]
MNSTIVKKEDLANYHFVITEVLTDPGQIKERTYLLEESLMLGNDFKHKVRLICQTTDGIIEVNATIWAVTDTHVELKSGKDIPIHSILEVIK